MYEDAFDFYDRLHLQAVSGFVDDVDSYMNAYAATGWEVYHPYYIDPSKWVTVGQES